MGETNIQVSNIEHIETEKKMDLQITYMVIVDKCL